MTKAFRSADVDGPFFRVYDDKGRHRELPLSPRRSRLTIGRSPKADISLSWDGEVSRVHAVAEYLGEQWTLLDGGLSLNGTFVNGDRLAGRHPLRPGDMLRMGNSRITFHDFTEGVGGDRTKASRDGLPTPGALTSTQLSVLIALCRPLLTGADGFALPATNQQIADELFFSLDTVKAQMRALFAKFGVADLPQNQKRARLANLAIRYGIISERDL
ncbi:FHA domain-containing protein [Nocardia sp. ET3-3]|uniref:FHA domain-containing protein n=1 Tax=Nocardia terrae TaxID=2675851 RepID=A0A7K1UPT8_9NOCA|nr:FHA domain-containing protein [Nocardia terrae]MVU75918.1 FHA domain-containing protein [Nocardia terrae]